MQNATGTIVKAFFPENTDGIVRVHGGECSHIVRDWRQHGTPMSFYAMSTSAIAKRLRREGIRFTGVYVLPCAALPQGYWSFTPNGEQLKLHTTPNSAKALTRKIRLAGTEFEQSFNKDNIPNGFKVTHKKVYKKSI